MRRLNYRHENILFERLKEQVNLPQFQRSLVWNKENKERFIDTVLKGDPFGVLLLYKDHNTNKYIIIDGLQRYTTLLEFSKSPYNFIEFNEAAQKSIEEVADLIIQEYTSSGKEYIIKEIKKDFKETLNKYIQEGNKEFSYVPNNLTDLTTKPYGSLSAEARNLIMSKFVNFWDEQSRNINIDKLEIPIILYNGDFSNLPEIFERLNTGGTKLTKYEVYSSSWSNIMLKLITTKNNKRVLTHIERKYIQLQKDTGIEITEFYEDKITNDGIITLYEYVYGLGKEIINNSKHITGQKRINYSKDDSIGFSTLATFYNLHLKDLEELPKFISNKTTSQELENTTAIILRVYREVDELLAPFIKDNTKYIEAQMISIVHTWFKLHFDVKNNKFERKAPNIDLIEKFKKNMPLRMLFDTINNYWAGSGDNKLHEIISGDINMNRYLRPISKGAWNNTLSNWLEEQNNKEAINVPADVRMFLSYITNINTELSYTRYLIIPKIFVNYPVNMGHLGNVIVAPVYKKFNKKDIITSSNKIEQEYMIPDEILYDPKESYNESEYNKIVNDRAKKLVNKFINKYY